MHWAEIICAIQKAGLSVSKIADQENVTQPMVTSVIRGSKTSHKVAYAIAAITNIPTERLWPGKYLESPAEYKKLRGKNKYGRLPAPISPELKAAS